MAGGEPIKMRLMPRCWENKIAGQARARLKPGTNRRLERRCYAKDADVARHRWWWSLATACPHAFADPVVTCSSRIDRKRDGHSSMTSADTTEQEVPSLDSQPFADL